MKYYIIGRSPDTGMWKTVKKIDVVSSKSTQSFLFFKYQKEIIDVERSRIAVNTAAMEILISNKYQDVFILEEDYHGEFLGKDCIWQNGRWIDPIEWS